MVAECTWQAQGAVLRVLGIYWRLSRLWLTEFGQKGMFYQVCGRFFFQKLQGHPHIDGQLLMGAARCIWSKRMVWYGMVDVYDGYLAAEASRSSFG